MKHFFRKITKLPRKAGVVLVKIYQYCISPLYVASCRFQPTCSEYASQALSRRGLIYGTFLTLWRLARCNPLFKGGWDPVPPGKRDECSCHKD